MTIYSIPITSVQAEDSLFDIFYRFPSRDFVDSVQRLGMLQPVYCFENSGAYTLIAGFKRWRAACEAGMPEIPAVVLPAASTPEHLLEIRLQLDAGDAHIPVLAQADLVRLAGAILEEPLEWVCRANLRRFLPMSRDIYDKLLSLANSGRKLREYFRKYDAPMTVVSTLLRQTDQFRNHVAEWALRFRIRPVELEKMLNGIVDCAKRSGQSAETCWYAVTAGEPVENEGHARAGYLADSKTRLNDLRYPYLESLRRNCSSAVDILRKNCGTTVAFDPSFESGTVTVSFPVSGEEDYFAAVSRLNSETAGNAIKEIFNHESD